MFLKPKISRTKQIPKYTSSEIDCESIRVLFLAPIYENRPIVVPSLIQQNYTNWRLLFMHDGPPTKEVQEYLDIFQDERITLLHSSERHAHWGHPLRTKLLQILKEELFGDLVVLTNSDNYYLPEFTKTMIQELKRDSIATYCNMLHRDFQRKPFETKLNHASIDIGCLMFLKEAAVAVQWDSTNYDADWCYIKKLLMLYSPSQFEKVSQYLFVHN